MSQVDKVLALLDNALQRAAGPCRGDDEPIDRDLCWRCQEAPPGEGSSGACDRCKAILLGDIEEPVGDGITDDAAAIRSGGRLHPWITHQQMVALWDDAVPLPDEVEQGARAAMLQRIATGLDLPVTFFDGDDVVRCALYTTPPTLTPERVGELYAEASGYDPWPAESPEQFDPFIAYSAAPWSSTTPEAMEPIQGRLADHVRSIRAALQPAFDEVHRLVQAAVNEIGFGFFLNGQWPNEPQPRPWKRHTPGRFRQRRRR